MRQSSRVVRIALPEERTVVRFKDRLGDLTRLVLADEEGTAWVRDPDQETLASGPMKHDGRVIYAVFSGDGRRVATTSESRNGQRTVRVWDARTGAPVSPLRRIGRGEAAEALSPDGRALLTSGTAADGQTEGHAQVWEADTLQPAAPPIRGAKYLLALFSPDGRWVLTGGDDTARVWDARTGEPLTPPIAGGYMKPLAFSPDGGRVLVDNDAPGDFRAGVFDARTGAVIATGPRYAWGIAAGAFSPNGRWVATASVDGTARIWDAATGQPVTPPLKHSGPVNALAFSEDGRRLATASDDGTARVWNARTGEAFTPPLRHSGPVWSVRFREGGRQLLTLDASSTVRAWDLGVPHAAPVFQHDAGARVSTALFSLDGRRLLTTGYFDRTARIWDAATGQPICAPIQPGAGVPHAEFSPDGKRLLTACWNGTARIWDAATGAPLTPRCGTPPRSSGRRSAPMASAW
jgi:WD40 repeat protein